MVDEALRKALDDYSRAFPNSTNKTITITTASRTQDISACTGLMNITKLVHPYNDAAADPFVCTREHFYLTWVNGNPTIFFSWGGIPQVNEKIYIEYTIRQTIENLDSASATTVRDDHQSMLITGAAGLASMSRASGILEQWGGKPMDPNQLLLWGNQQYRRFLDFLADIRTEQITGIFPDSFWDLDDYDSKDNW